MQKIATVCPYCGCGCGLYVTVENGKATNVEYMSEHPVNKGALCPKGNAALEVINHPDRLLYPMRKRRGTWIKISWDKAFNSIVSNFRKIRDAQGPDTLGFISSAKCTNEENYSLQKLARMLGTNNIDHCARLCHASTLTGLTATLGRGAMTNPIPDLANSDCIFIIGSNFAENHPMVSGWVWDAKDKGAKIIVVDPRYSPTAWMSDIFLEIKPGTDIALINGMIHYIIKENLTNKDFIRKRTSGFEQIVTSIEKYTLPLAEDITGIPQDKIRQVARIYAKAKRGAIIFCMGITQHTCGSDNVIALANLALVCGQVGRVGTGVFPLRGQDNVQGACDMGALPDFLPGYIRVNDEAGRAEIAQKWGWENLPKRPGLTVVEMINAAAEGRIRGMYIMGENPLVSAPNTQHVQEALKNLDFLVVQDIFLNETTELADVILPAACWAEKEGTVTATDRSVQWRPKIVAPPGEAKTDLDIICEIAERLGLGFNCQNAEEVLREVSDVIPSYAGITPEQVKERIGGVTWPCPFLDNPGTSVLHTESFGTPDSLGHMIPVEYQFPAEQPNDKYPLTLTTGRVAMNYNTGAMTRKATPLLRRDPGLFVEINPKDVENLNIENDDEVEISTKRGKIKARAVITETIIPGVVFIPFHFPGANVLTIDALDPQAKIPEFKVCACKINKK